MKKIDLKTLEKARLGQIDSDFLLQLSAPARRALENNGITTLQKLSEYSEKEILKMHGIGPASLSKFRNVLSDENLLFKN